MPLPTNRTVNTTIQEHVDDHNTAHGLLNGLNGTYVTLTTPQEVAARHNFAGGLTSRADDGSAINAKNDALAGVFNWTLRGAAGYLLHFTTDTPGSVGSALIGLGPDAGGNGLLISNKSGGTGIYLTNEITNNVAADSFGFRGRQASTTAPLMFLESIFGGSAPLLRLYGGNWGAGQVMSDVMISNGDTTEEILAQTGEHRFYNAGIRVSNAKAQASRLNLCGLPASSDMAMRWYRDTGGGTFYTTWLHTVVDEFRLSMRPASATNDGSETMTHPFLRIKDTGSLLGAFFGADPVLQPVGTSDLRLALIDLGLRAAGGATPLNLNGGKLTASHITSSGSNPAVAPLAAAGSGATATVTGDDTSGNIGLATGTGAAIGDQLTVTFAATFGSAPKALVLTPANPNAATVPIYVGVTATTWTLTLPTSVTSSTQYYWFYEVIG